MGNGQWELGMHFLPLPMPHAQCPMTAGATTFVTSRAGSPLRIDPTDNRARGLTATHCLPHAPCPMTAGATTRGTRATHCLPNAQFSRLNKFNSNFNIQKNVT
ncbi:MAG: hypothetical protein KME31_11715 [Tolypothrix carrinoi HA7290-LM1]|nr:hypothetical protein [Tolypothrix carrinoi HA7290-LM1]